MASLGSQQTEFTGSLLVRIRPRNMNASLQQIQEFLNLVLWLVHQDIDDFQTKFTTLPGVCQ